MNRLQKKCFIVVGGMHLLLLVILVVGPAFFSPSSQSSVAPLDFIPSSAIDGIMQGGGSPQAHQSAQPPAQQQTQPQPPQPPAHQEPVTHDPPVRHEEPQQVVERQRPNADSFERRPVERPKNTNVNLNLVDRAKPTRHTTTNTADNTAAQAAADRKRRANELQAALRNLKSGLSTSTKIEGSGTDAGPGGGGPSYGNFYAAVEGIYQRAWEDDRPSGVAAESTAVVSVTITRDGTVLSARIIQPSGDSRVDQSVQRVLNSVRDTLPFPAGATEEQRTVTIDFVAKPDGAIG